MVCVPLQIMFPAARVALFCFLPVNTVNSVNTVNIVNIVNIVNTAKKVFSEKRER